MPVCAVVSFRLGTYDGVSVVAAIWQRVLEGLGYETYTVAGFGYPDVLLPWLGAKSRDEPRPDELASVLSRADLVLAENMALPLNLPACITLTELLKGRPAIMHHHDLPWQREQYGHIVDLPADDPNWRHVVINDRSLAQMLDRGIPATRIYNPFDMSPPQGDIETIREQARAQLELAEDELLAIHPARGIRRKNIHIAVAIAEKLEGTYWLVGGAEDGYETTLERILSAAKCRVITPPPAILETDTEFPMNDRFGAHQMYAASDVVVFPSFWEGFGNPPIEAAIHKKPIIVGDYPIAEELRSLGFRWFYPEEVDAVLEFLEKPDEEMLEHNRALAEEHFSIEVITPQIAKLL